MSSDMAALIGVILGPLLENYFLRALRIAQGDLGVLFSSKIGNTLWVLLLISLLQLIPALGPLLLLLISPAVTAGVLNVYRAVEHGDYEDGDPEVRAFEKSYWEGKSRMFADVTDVVAHIRRVVDLVGIDHVGLGSDFDGVGDSLPTGLKDVSEYPNLIEALLRDGFSEDEVAQVLSGNLMRVWREVERIAAES